MVIELMVIKGDPMGILDTRSRTVKVDRRARRRIRRSAPVLISGAVAVAMLAGYGLTSPAVGAARTAKATPKATPKVLLVGTYKGVKGGYTTIQSAVDAAKPGDFILIGPGDYHEDNDIANPPTAAQASVGDMGGVLITTSGLTLRGMNRKTVIVDGTKAGAPKPCDSAAKYQDFGVTPNGAKEAYGRDGILIWKANDVTVDNLTVCNFLAGTGGSGNELWWNGGAESGKVGLKGYWADYITATSSFFSNETTAAQYGIFSSNSAGPAEWYQLYANNFNDSGMYVGACHQVCDVTIDHTWMENNALGYSGTNSGGQVIIEHSQFDHNQDGLDTNTAISGDPPGPQNGQCPNGKTSTITHTRSCWVIRNNYIHDNNNPSTPKYGSAAAGPTGTGMTVSGGRWDTIEHNQFSNNGAWGILFVPYPDSGTPVLGQSCKEVGGTVQPPFGCLLDPEGDALLHNSFTHDGYFGNPTNSDYGQITWSGNEPSNCFRGNHAPNGSAPSNLEAIQPTCGVTTKAGNHGGALLNQVLCDTGYGTCKGVGSYPQSSKVILTSVPKNLPTMPNPCAGVPTNPWCPKNGSKWGGTSRSHGSHTSHPARRTIQTAPWHLGLAAYLHWSRTVAIGRRISML